MRQFYPAFKMESNPFKHADRADENASDTTYDIVRTNAVEMVEGLIWEGAKTIVVGEKGCGKSTVIDSIKNEDGVLGISGISYLRDLCTSILRHQFIMGMVMENSDEQFQNIADDFYNERKGNIPDTRKDDGTTTWGNVLVCRDRRCVYRNRCPIGTRSTREGVGLIDSIINMSPKDVLCPLRQWLAISMLSRLTTPSTLLIDVPDKIVDKHVKYFENFITDMTRAISIQVILMASQRQFDTIRKKSDYFMRWKGVRFPPPDNEELKEILRSRVDGVFPFNDDALEYLVVGCKGNPRTLIRRSSSVLGDMKRRKIKEPVDSDFVKRALESLIMVASISERDAVLAAFNMLYKELGSVYFLAKDMVVVLKDVYGVEMSAFTLGWHIKDIMLSMGIDKVDKKGPYIKYRLIRVGIGV